jgi:hypothetical protein
MAPETFTNSRHLPASDVYSLGMIIWEVRGALLTDDESVAMYPLFSEGLIADKEHFSMRHVVALWPWQGHTPQWSNVSLWLRYCGTFAANTLYTRLAMIYITGC